MTSMTRSRLAALACLAACAAAADSAATAAGPSLERVATLRTARAAHTATALPSGQVLLVGGLTDDESSTASVELFDPARLDVHEAGPLGAARCGHTATLLGDGRVLVAGGYDSEYLRSLEVFEPSTGVFRPAGALLEARSGHTATLLPDGRVLFTGGVGRGWTFLASAELFDPATGRCEPAAPLSVPRESHTATRLADGRVLVVGGHTGRREAMEVYASAETFVPDAGAGRFEPAGALATPRHKHDAIALLDGRVLVLGGATRDGSVHHRSTEIFDPARGRFGAGPSMAHGRYKIAGTSIRLPDGDVLVTAGAPVAERLDVERLAFSELPGRFPAAYRFAAAAPLREGGVLVAGGYTDENRNTAGVWRLGTR